MKNIIVNRKIYISNGKILNNPFLPDLLRTESSQWYLNNQGDIKRIIASKLTESSSLSVDDCFSFGLSYFLNNQHNIFDSSYGDENYNIRVYVISQIGDIVKAYISSNKKKLEESSVDVLDLEDMGNSFSNNENMFDTKEVTELVKLTKRFREKYLSPVDIDDYKLMYDLFLNATSTEDLVSLAARNQNISVSYIQEFLKILTKANDTGDLDAIEIKKLLYSLKNIAKY